MRLFNRYKSKWFNEFQFTHPGRGATDYLTYAPVKVEVSIHAPREGCDDYEIVAPLCKVTFQFTHPGRGATMTSVKHLAVR